MNNLLMKIEGAKSLTKEVQKRVNGGRGCPSGCFSLFFGSGTGRCAIPGSNGQACFGSEVNGQCCL